VCLNRGAKHYAYARGMPNGHYGSVNWNVYRFQQVQRYQLPQHIKIDVLVAWSELVCAKSCILHQNAHESTDFAGIAPNFVGIRKGAVATKVQNTVEGHYAYFPTKAYEFEPQDSGCFCSG
jgi:hypothetical protein